MTSIFGPPKRTRKVNDILIGDFVTFTKKIKFANAALAMSATNDNNDNDDNCSDNGDDNDGDQSKESDNESDEGNDKQSSKDDEHSSNGELEPTDFVSIKIEPMDEDEQPDVTD